MSVPILGYSVVVKKETIEPLLQSGKIAASNRMMVGDDHIVAFGFMAEADAIDFVSTLEEQGINATKGPDSDAVLTCEFHQQFTPYCEWLHLAKVKNTVIGFREGSDPSRLFAPENFDLENGSGLVFSDKSELEFLRLEDNVEVYRNVNTGEEVFIGRTSTPTEALFQSAAETIRKHFRTAGQSPLSGTADKKVRAAIDDLMKVNIEAPDHWPNLFFIGKAHIALGQLEESRKWLERAAALESETESIYRELAGVYMELGEYGRAVETSQKGAVLKPDCAETLGNVAISLLLAGRTDAARKAIIAALKLKPQDKINLSIQHRIGEVESGIRPKPNSIRELSKPLATLKNNSKPWWKFW